MTKTKEFLTGRTIVEVENPPRAIRLILDNGDALEIKVIELVNWWESIPALDFIFTISANEIEDIIEGE